MRSHPPADQRRATSHGRAWRAALRADDARPSVLNEVVPRHWWENLLHNQTSLRLKLRLFGRKNTIVVDVPFHLR